MERDTQTENRWRWSDNILYLNIHSLLQAFGSVSGQWRGIESIFSCPLLVPTIWTPRTGHNPTMFISHKMFSNKSFIGLINLQLQRLYSTSATRNKSEVVTDVACIASGGDTPIHYLYGHVPPNRVVILKLLIYNGVSISEAFSRTGYNIW